MKICYKVVLLFFFVSFFSRAQQQNITSSLEDSIKSNIYSNPNKAIRFLHQYLKINETNNDVNNIILANSTLAAAHEVINEIDSTLYYHYKNLSIVQMPVDIVNTKYSIARVLEQQDKSREALRLYYQALELAKKNNLVDAIRNVEISIETLKVKLGKSKDGLDVLRKDYESKVATEDSNLRFTRKTLIEAYIKSENYEEASALIKVGIDDAERFEDCEFIYYMNMLKSNIHILKNELSHAYDDCKQALNCAIQLNNQGFINEIKFREAEIAFLKKDFGKTIENLEFIHNSVTNKSTEQLTRYYKLSADTYKRVGSSDLSSDYYAKYITEKEKLSETRFANLETLYTLNLKERVSEYEDELQQANTKNETVNLSKRYWIYLSLGLLGVILIIIVFFKNKSSNEQKKFTTLIKKIDDYEKWKTNEKLNVSQDQDNDKTIMYDVPCELDEEEVQIGEVLEDDYLDQEADDVITNEDNHITDEDDDKSDGNYIIDEEKVEEILMKIQRLEDKLYFLRQDCTLHSMAKKLKTNTSYLSKIINTHLDKSFSLYINELRINYAILELKHNKRLRAYSVKGIAQEMGYKNADAFSRYFRAATGISPSVYIKKIKEIKTDS